MGIKFTSEAQIEETLIEILTEEESKWTYASHLKTDDQLWDNFFQILTQNNVRQLNGNPLTEDEKSQIRMQLNFSNFYDAGEWLSGENGIAQVQIQRSDARLGIVNLQVHNANHIAGGISTYQIINQAQRDKQDATDRNRRLDVSLLINGIPLIHIELKARTVSTNEAFNQIQKYDKEGKFSGIFSMIQTFVISNGANTQYIAAAKNYNLDANHLTFWVNDDNTTVRDLYDFARSVLTIPMAHELVTDYTVLDYKRKALITLRPYQIHATKAVLRALNKDQSGYIWHTTGSGKTLTSYKTSKTILKRPSLDKVLFLVDRKELDTQTTGEFQSYAENDTVDVSDTRNVRSLVKTLLSGQREVIVTTSQKLNHLIKRYERDDLSIADERDRDRLRKLKLAFVVDECHRAVSSEQQRRINRFFAQPVKLWYGFTGTPIFKAKSGIKGDLATTTQEQYGDSLHEYTIKEAIYDRNVLPFHVDYVETLSEDSIYDYLLEKLIQGSEDPDTGEYTEGLPRDQAILKVDAMSITERESKLEPSVYETEAHRLQVIDQVINRSRAKLGIGSGRSDAYSSILTVNSIKNAQEYYKLFKEVIAGDHPDLKVSERVSKALVDFPRVAITYSLSENEDRSYDDQTALSQAMDDYNNHFSTNFTPETVDAYNRNLTERLARKRDEYKVRKAQVDIVIVVDRLLTGFDAPPLSTLFIDRNVMPPHSLVQAFSRTNRLYKKKKANIVTLRTPNIYKEEVRNAISMYSAGANPDDILADAWDVAKDKMVAAVEDFQALLATITGEDILSPGVSDEKKRQYMKAFQDLDRQLENISVYSEYIDLLDEDEDALMTIFNISHEELETHHGIYLEIREELKKDMITQDFNFDFEYELSLRYREDIDYEYIISLMDKYQDVKLKASEIEEIERYLADLSRINPKLGAMLKRVWEGIQAEASDLEGRRVIDILEDYKDDYITGIIDQLSRDWLVDRKHLEYLIRNYKGERSHQLGWNTIARQVRSRFDSNHTYPADPQPTRLNVKSKARNEIYSVIEDEILPLRF